MISTSLLGGLASLFAVLALLSAFWYFLRPDSNIVYVEDNDYVLALQNFRAELHSRRLEYGTSREEFTFTYLLRGVAGNYRVWANVKFTPTETIVWICYTTAGFAAHRILIEGMVSGINRAGIASAESRHASQQPKPEMCRATTSAD